VEKDTLVNGLLDIGFTENEASVYLAALELKEALASSIAKRAGVKRPTTYVLLECLQRKGLVSVVKKNGHFFFHVNHPCEFIEEEMDRTEKLFKSLKSLESGLPELLAEHSQYIIPSQVSVFRGKEGWCQMIADVLKASTEVLSWTNPEHWTKVLSVCSATDQKKLQRIRKRKIESEFSCEKIVYDNKLALLFLEDEIGILLQSRPIAEAYRAQFEEKRGKV
jgi:sugar-specific transcriptional regulator TrmB